jgi:hypothetical protein
MQADDLKALAYAKQLLEHPGLAVKLAHYLGYPLEKAINLIPATWAKAIAKITNRSLVQALNFAVSTLGGGQQTSSEGLHKASVAATGAVGGAFGLAGLGLELPLTTIVMLRSIADIARSEGEDINRVETQIACLEVFALGGKTGRDDASEVGYFAIRSALAKEVTDAVRYISQRSLMEEGAPAILRLVTAIASRFGLTVTEKAAAQAVPLIGAAGGLMINTIFIDHFQNMARGHFIVRRLERAYGREDVERHYNRL